MNRIDATRIRTALAALAFASLPVAHAAGVSDKEIVLGMHIDLSGPAAAGSPHLRNGTQLRVDEANAAGGIHGRKIRLIIEDNAGAPQQGVRAVQKLLRQDGVFAIINSFGTGPNAATVKMISDAGVVNFAPWAASSALQKISGNSPLLFTVVQNYDTTTGYGVSWALKTWGSKKVGLLAMEGPFGELIKGGLVPVLTAHGQSLAAEATYKPGEIDLSSQVARLKAAGVDLIVAGTVVRETIAVMSEVRKLGWTDVKVLTALPGRNSTVSDLGKDTVEGLYGIGGWNLPYAETTDAAGKRFIESYRRAFGAAPNDTAADAYSYTDWFIGILQAAGPGLTAESFSKAAASQGHEDFVAYTAQKFARNHAMPESVSIDQVRAGRWVQITKPFTGLVK